MRRAAYTLVWRLQRLDLAPAPSLVLHWGFPGHPSSLGGEGGASQPSGVAPTPVSLQLCPPLG